MHSYLYSFLNLLRSFFVFGLIQRRLRNGKCRAELSTDAPVAMAIGACILNSLIFPVAPSPEDVEAESLIDSADARFAVMGIISFIPYFNWMVIFSFPPILGIQFNILVFHLQFYDFEISLLSCRVGCLLGWILENGVMLFMLLSIQLLT